MAEKDAQIPIIEIPPAETSQLTRDERETTVKENIVQVVK